MFGQIIPIIDVYRSNKKLKRKDGESFDKKSNVNLDDLYEQYRFTIDTKNRFEDKAKTIVAALTISITLILNLTRMIDDVIDKISNEKLVWFVLFLSIASILYMIFAGLLAVQVLIKENIVHLVSLDKRKDEEEIIVATEKNIRQNLIRNNMIYGAYLSIRNSVICLFIIFVFAIIPCNEQEENVLYGNSTGSENIFYSRDVVDWCDSSALLVDFDNFVRYNHSKLLEGKETAVYDEKNGVLVIVKKQNDMYLVCKVIEKLIEND